MVSYLLLPAVILCVVVSQPANITGTEKPKNETTSFYKDEFKAIENDLEKNNTFLVISEDNENFQDQKNEFLHQHCHQDLLINLSHVHCGEPFHAEMHNIHADEWCVLKSIIRPYNDLTQCLELVTEYTGCYFPNPDIQDFFLYIHSTYFQNCMEKAEDQFQDAPTSLVVALTIIPVSLIPVMVCLVLWKS
ncbi:receptor activity-modifying protein 3-like isoform X2 [Girardinichthys multiradiatus]|uniref:receptor activity-modifying protein 3-like isoform X2 n=1 Tax=Girardinichthys multiradiatus TaxID=208333 RepID=UPI001FAD11EE|nr:receptor activity-modifying protein 3-like isoform X2 [Girardinichthys multiradiatus]